MTGALAYITVETASGWVGILASTKGLLVTTLPQRSAEEARQLLGETVNHATLSRQRFADLVARFKDYFKAQRATFADEVDLSEATPFQRQVWQATRLIPYGETRSYLWVAKQMRRPEAVRAVGQALGRNPLPIIIPCHRVLASDGRLGGFTGGLEVKRHLLHLEGAADYG